MSTYKIIIACVVALLSTALNASQLTPEQEAAKVRGLTLYNQFKDGEHDLRVAAMAGDRESQFYLAKDLQNTARYMTAESQKWYTAAAEQGDMYAMYQLSHNSSGLCHAMGNCPAGTRTAGEWGNLLINTATPLAKQGDGEAMYMMYLVTGDLEWLKKPAKPGFPFKQYWLAIRYKNDEGFIFPPWQRSDRIMELYGKAAEGGYPVGMYAYADKLQKKGSIDDARRWIIKSAEAGYTSTFSEYAYGMADPENRWGIPIDYTKSYGLISLLLELNGGGEMLPFAKSVLPRIAKHLTPEQIEEAKKIGEEWKATHPPLSYFPQKLGF
ncbi:tetratricopeptide repeat protein [Pseudomonas nicosulfuronedens]